jgi:probable HAF family extracellular repeat protein
MARTRSTRRRRLLAVAAAAVALGAVALAADIPVAAAGQPQTTRPEAARRDPTTSEVGRSHAFVRDARGVTTFDAPGATWITSASGSDNSGRVVGVYVDGKQRFHGFVRNHRGVTRIDVPGAAGTLVSKINEQGQMVGAYTEDRATSPSFFEHGFVRDRRGIRRIDVPGAVETRALGINNRGQIVGSYVDGAGRAHGFLRDARGRFTTIDPPGAEGTLATDVDDRGRVVGTYVDATPSFHGFVRELDGTITTVDAPGATDTAVFGINDRGQLAGGSRGAPDFIYRGFVADGGRFTTVEVPGSTGGDSIAYDIDDRGRVVGDVNFAIRGYLRDRDGDFTTFAAPFGHIATVPQGVNDRGQVVGFATDDTATDHGFVRSDRGQFTRIDAPGARSTQLVRINDRGDILGISSATSPNLSTDARGFLLRDGRFTPIHAPGATETLATGLNDRGEIVGRYVDAAGTQHSFLRDRRGTYTDIDVPDAIATVVVDINDHGQIVGYSVDDQGVPRGFRRDRDGSVTTIRPPAGAPAGGSGVALGPLPGGLNNRGQVVGAYRDAQFQIYGFAFDGGRVTPVKARDAFGESFATEINDRGSIVGITR